MPASIHNTREASKLFNAAPIPSPSLTSSTVSCDSIKTIEAWLDNVERPEVTVIVKDLSKAGPDLAQEPEIKNTRKRKHSSPFSEETSSQSSIQKRSQPLPQLVLGYALSMAQPTTGNTMEGVQVCHSSPSTQDGVADCSQTPMTPTTSSASEMRSTTSSTPTTSKEAGWVGRRLEMHGIYCDPKALKKYPDFANMISDIVNGNRHSEMKQKSIERVQHYGHLCGETNEATFLATVVPLIIKVDRTVKFEHTEPSGNSLELAGDGDSVVQDPEPRRPYGSRDWLEDGIFAVVDQDFRKDCLPHCFADKDLARKMKKVDGMTTPRPDRCYGLEPNWIRGTPGVQLDVTLHDLVEACPHLSYPFFLIEGKSNDGSKIAAENQARRGGASLVNAKRQILEKIGELPAIANGVDDSNFVFSAVLYPGGIGIWVHWIELVDGKPWFHMNHLRSLAMEDPNCIRESRKILNNILSWGCDLDKRGLKELHRKMYAWQIQETARVAEENAEEARQKEEKRQEKLESRKRLRSE